MTKKEKIVAILKMSCVAKPGGFVPVKDVTKYDPDFFALVAQAILDLDD